MVGRFLLATDSEKVPFLPNPFSFDYPQFWCFTTSSMRTIVDDLAADDTAADDTH
jgi:hypothetical protein